MRQHRHHHQTDLDGRDISQSTRHRESIFHSNDYPVNQGSTSQQDEYRSHLSDPNITRQRPQQHDQGRRVSRYDEHSGLRESSQSDSRSAPYQASASGHNQGHTTRHYQQQSSSRRISHSLVPTERTAEVTMSPSSWALLNYQSGRGGRGRGIGNRTVDPRPSSQQTAAHSQPT